MTDSRYEHLDFDKEGELKGLWHLDPSKAKGVGTHDYWGKLEEIIEAYTKIHPTEIVDALAHCAQKREMSYNDYGLNVEDKNSTMRLGMALPNGLLIQIMTFDPEFLAPGGKLNQFRKRFPGFNTSRK